MSHSRIFQIAEEPVSVEDYIEEHDFYENWFVGAIADYVSSDCTRDDDLKSLRFLLERNKAASFNESNNSFTIIPGGKESYFAQAYDNFATEREKTLNVGLTEFASSGDFAESVRLMGAAFNEEFSYYVVPFEDEIITLDEFIRYAEIGKHYYIGGTLDYHY